MISAWSIISIPFFGAGCPDRLGRTKVFKWLHHYGATGLPAFFWLMTNSGGNTSFDLDRHSSGHPYAAIYGP
jgi:hypothetical protein